MNTKANTRMSVTKRMMQVAVALLVAVGLTGLGVTTAGAAQPDRPFGAVVTGTIRPSIDGTTFVLEGQAFSPGLGQMGYHGEVQITGVDQNGVITDVLTETFTTAKGDTLVIRCDQVATPIDDGVYLGEDTWSVIGGTGKLAGATGSGTGATYVDLNTLTFTKVLTGTFSQGR